MAYDFREIIFKEMLELSPSDEFYFTKRVSKAQFLLSDEEMAYIDQMFDDFRHRYGLGKWSLFFIERKLRRGAGIKVRDGATARKLSCMRLIKDLMMIDSQIDIMVKLKAKEIRFSGSLDFIRKASAQQ